MSVEVDPHGRWQGRTHMLGGQGHPYGSFEWQDPQVRRVKRDPHVRLVGQDPHVKRGGAAPTCKWIGLSVMGPTCQGGGVALIGNHMSY
jgi:hypothetical protein